MNAPAKAAFYSAVLPGVGQIYNKQYWKLPVVFGALGTGIYFIKLNTDKYESFRIAYFNRKNGLPDDFPQYNDNILIEAQEFYKNQRDTSIMITVLIYFLNIIDANVSAHLKQWDVNKNLSLRAIQLNNNNTAIGLRINLKF